MTKICNTFIEYEGQISGDLKIDIKIDSNDSGSCHVDITFGKVKVSQIDIKVEDNRNAGYQWESKDN